MTPTNITHPEWLESLVKILDEDKKAKCIEAFEKENKKKEEKQQFRLYVKVLEEAVSLHRMRQDTLKLKSKIYEVEPFFRIPF